MSVDNYPDWVSRTWVDSTMAAWTISADRNNDDGILLSSEADSIGDVIADLPNLFPWAYTDGAE